LDLVEVVNSMTFLHLMCRDLIKWYCDLVCCKECSDQYENAYQCAEETLGFDIGKCSRQCNLRTIAAILAEGEDLSTLFAFVDQKGLLDDLDAGSNLMLFAPMNEAFDEVNLPSDGPEDNICSVLLYHVVNGSAKVEDGNIHSTLINAMVFISVSTMNETRVNDSEIIQSITASNGLVYIIDAVLLPFEAPSNSPSESSSEATTQVGTVEPMLGEGNERTLGPMAEAPSSKIPNGSPSELSSD
jgi:uncharacterized surface protein with fasciclin (FAS1) repeats